MGPYWDIAFTTAKFTNGASQTVAGIAGTPSLLPYFNRGIIFEAGQPDFTQGDAGDALGQKLISFFGTGLGCSAGITANADTRSQYQVHAAMNITQELFDAFNTQVANAALSFGVSSADVATVGAFLAGFGKQTFGPNSKAICTQADCSCASGYGGSNCQSVVSTTGSSTGSNSGGSNGGSSTGSNGGSSNGGGAAGGLSDGSGAVTEFIITLSTDISAYNSTQKQHLQDQLTADISKALSIISSAITFKSLQSGSTIAVFDVGGASSDAQAILRATAGDSADYPALSQNTAVGSTTVNAAAATTSGAFAVIAAMAAATAMLMA